MRTQYVALIASLLVLLLPGIGQAYVDADSDNVQDADDNCLGFANSDQADRNSNGYGNACDADCDGDTGVGVQDFLILGAEFGNSCATGPCTCDFNDDGGVGIPDYVQLSAQFGTIGPPRSIVLDRVPAARACHRCRSWIR